MADKVKIEIKNKAGKKVSGSAEGEGGAMYAYKRGPGTSERVNRQIKNTQKAAAFFKHTTKGK